MSAKSRLAASGLANEWTEVTLPDAEIDHRSSPGPLRSLGGRRLDLDPQPVMSFQLFDRTVVDDPACSSSMKT